MFCERRSAQINQHQGAADVSKQRTIKPELTLLLELVTCDGGMSQAYTHILLVTHRLTKSTSLLSVFSLAQSCNASAEVKTAFDVEAGHK